MGPNDLALAYLWRNNSLATAAPLPVTTRMLQRPEPRCDGTSMIFPNRAILTNNGTWSPNFRGAPYAMVELYAQVTLWHQPPAIAGTVGVYQAESTVFSAVCATP